MQHRLLLSGESLTTENVLSDFSTVTCIFKKCIYRKIAQSTYTQFIVPYSAIQKFGHTFTPCFVFIFYCFLHCKLRLNTKNKLCGNQKKCKHVLYFRFFRVVTFCSDNSFAHSWHSLKQLHEVPGKLVAMLALNF